MSSKVTKYIETLLRPLEDLHNSYTQFANQHRDISGRLRSHARDLLSGSFPFEGMGAKAFEILVNYYLDMVEKEMQIFDDAAGAVKNCHFLISAANGVADAAGLNDALVEYILGQVTHNDIIQQGSAPIWGVVNDMQRTLGNMSRSNDDMARNLLDFHFGAALGDLVQMGGDTQRLLGDMMNLVLDAGRVLGQWTESVCDAVGKCLTTIGTVAAKALEFALPLGEILVKAVVTSEIAGAKDAFQFITSQWNTISSGIQSLGFLPPIIKDIKAFEDIKAIEKLSGFLEKVGEKTDLFRGGTFGAGFSGLSVLFDVLGGQDKSPRDFFSDMNGTFISNLPWVNQVSNIVTLASTAWQIEGLGQQNLIAPWLAGGNSTLEKELSDPGLALNDDAQRVSLNDAFKHLGNALYDGDVLGERGDVQSVQQLSHDIMHNPQNLPQDLLHAGLEAGVGATGVGFDQDPGAQLSDLKKTGKDLGGAVLSLGETGVDLDASESEDVAVASGVPPSWIAPMHQAWQWEHQPIESFRNWLSKLPTS